LIKKLARRTARGNRSSTKNTGRRKDIETTNRKVKRSRERQCQKKTRTEKRRKTVLFETETAKGKKDGKGEIHARVY